jgi:hypothetical protein
MATSGFTPWFAIVSDNLKSWSNPHFKEEDDIDFTWNFQSDVSAHAKKDEGSLPIHQQLPSSFCHTGYSLLVVKIIQRVIGAILSSKEQPERILVL